MKNYRELRRPRPEQKPAIITGRKIIEDQDRDDDRRLKLVGVPERASTSTALQRCNFCQEWRSAKADGRCSHCRQKMGTAPLKGLPRAS